MNLNWLSMSHSSVKADNRAHAIRQLKRLYEVEWIELPTRSVQYVRHLTGQKHKIKSPVSCRTYCTPPAAALYCDSCRALALCLRNRGTSWQYEAERVVCSASPSLNVCWCCFSTYAGRKKAFCEMREIC